MKAAFNVAIWEWCRNNPVRRISMGKVNNALVRYLDDGTFERVVKACLAWVQPIVLTARFTGIQRGNLVDLRWGQVGIERKVILLEHTKNGDRLRVPLYTGWWSCLRIRFSTGSITKLAQAGGTSL